jgi:hypothetical protein
MPEFASAFRALGIGERDGDLLLQGLPFKGAKTGASQLAATEGRDAAAPAGTLFGKPVSGKWADALKDF